MKLYLLRHSKTEQSADSDFNRKLLPKGVAQSIEMSLYLNQNSIKPDLIICSSSARTMETLSLLNVNCNPENIHFSDELYLASARQIMLAISDYSTSNEKTILIVGHNDGISELARNLTNTEMTLKTCALAEFEISTANWKLIDSSNSHLLKYFRPEVNS